MKAYITFIKKELCENIRTYKILILGVVFMLFGIMSPLTAKFMPELMSTFMPEGMNITISQVTAYDSWAQFFKNISQMGLFVIVIIFSGLMSGEYAKGTLINVLTKGLSRSTVILSKYTSAFLIWTGGYMVSFLLTYGYTMYFWKEGADTVKLMISVLSLWLFGIFILSLIMLGGALFKAGYGCLMFVGGAVVFQMLLNIIPKMKKYNPITLASGNMALLQGQMAVKEIITPIIITLILTAVLVISACIIFDKKKL